MTTIKRPVVKRRNFRIEKLCFEDKKRVVILYCRGKTHREISKLTGISQQMVQKIVNEYHTGRTRNWTLTEREERLVIMMYENNHGGSTIAKYFGWPEDVVYRILKRNNIKIRPFTYYRQYDLDENFFETIDSEEKAYWVGFLMADGAIGEGRRILLRLSNKDFYHIQRFQKSLRSNYPYYHDTKTNVSGCTIQSKKMCRDLAKYGVVENKTFKTLFPTTKGQSNNDLIRHFIRGYFDGDGSISVGENKKGHTFANLSICGYEPFLLKMQDFFIDELGLGRTKLIKEKAIHSLRYGGRRQVEKIMDWMYKDATIYLDRKHQRYLLLKEQRKPN